MRGLIKRGTADEIASAVGGFSANGESAWSRSAARSGKARDGEQDRPPRPKNLSRDELIARTTKRIAKLRCDISLETGAVRRAKLERDLAIKSELLTRLKAER
jgi:hypothetical protein